MSVWNFITRSMGLGEAPGDLQLIANPPAQEDETRSLSDPDNFLLDLLDAAPVAAGVSVGPKAALSVPAVLRGVGAISGAMSLLPLAAYQIESDGAKNRLHDHIASRLLNGEANPWTMGPQLRELMTADAIVHGNAYALIVRDGAGFARELHRIYPPSVSIEIDPITTEPRYRVSLASGQRLLSYHDILHIRAPATAETDGVTGVSPLRQAREAIGILIVMQQHASRLFANGARPSSILTFPQSLPDDERKNLIKSLTIFSRRENAGRTLLVDRGGKFEPLTFSSADAQFLELWQHSIIEVARVLDVPPVLLMDLQSGTYNNSETTGQQFLTFTLQPWLSRWEAEVTLKLIDAQDRSTVCVDHQTDALLKVDFAAKATAHGQYRAAGVMTANEVRKDLNLPPLHGGDVLQNPYTTTTTTKIEPMGGKSNG